MTNPASYTAKDLERYHRGDMPAAEKHAMQKAALDDPMLADALEGFAFTTAQSTELEQLQTRLMQRLEKEEKGRVHLLQSTWLKIAAVFVVFCGGGWLAFKTLVTPETDLATVQPEASGRATIAAPVQDSSATAAPQSSQLPAESESKTGNAPTAKTQPKTSEATAATASRPAEDLAPAQTFLTETAQANSERPKADVVIIAKKDKTEQVAEGFTRDTGNSIAAMRQRGSTPEVVANRTLAKAKTGLPREAIPLDGWPAFEKYVADNRKELPADNSQSGEVELIFDIDKKGQPTHITVARPLCKSCDAEAIRLLEKGPAWKGTSGRVIIRFPK